MKFSDHNIFSRIAGSDQYFIVNLLTGNADILTPEKAFANPRIKFIFEHEPREFVKEGQGVRKVVIEDLKTHQLKTIDCDGVFIFAGMAPNLDEFKQSIELDQWGYVKTDGVLTTNLKGVYAAGDVSNKPYRQITTAVSDGTVAAIAVTKELEAAS